MAAELARHLGNWAGFMFWNKSGLRFEVQGFGLRLEATWEAQLSHFVTHQRWHMRMFFSSGVTVPKRFTSEMIPETTVGIVTFSYNCPPHV